VKVLLTQLMVLGIALPFQLGLVPLNARTRWLTVGELRFWTISIFVFVEICYLIAS
jgi:hypothetical protein